MPSTRTLALYVASALLLAVTLLGVASAQAKPPAAPPSVVAEARQLLADLVAVDSTQTGSTTPALERIAALLRGAGFGDEDLWIVGARADRMNLVVRFRSPGSLKQRLKPILFLAHLDVVAADRKDWSVDPFRLTEQDGFLYGRGTVDVKGEAALLAVSLARLKREGLQPGRDVILAFTADEEEGRFNGVEWLLANRRELIDAATVINTDAGGVQQERGRFARVAIQTSEKLYLTFELETSHPGGHSALPTRDNAIYELAAALGRLDGFAFPVTLNASTRPFFERLAEIEAGPLASAFRGVLETPPSPAAVEALSAIPLYNGTLRTVCTPTLLSAGHAENALPQRATATLQCRLLPDADPAAIQAEIEKRIANPHVRVSALAPPIVAPPSPIDPEIFRAVEAVSAQCWPGVPVLPVMDVWASDGALLRRAGIPVYGVASIYFDIDDYRAHGRDERIATAAFERGVEFMYRLMRELGASSR